MTFRGYNAMLISSLGLFKIKKLCILQWRPEVPWMRSKDYSLRL